MFDKLLLIQEKWDEDDGNFIQIIRMKIGNTKKEIIFDSSKPEKKLLYIPKFCYINNQENDLKPILKILYHMGIKYSKISQDESLLFKHINPSTFEEDVKNGKITMIIDNCLPDIVIGRVLQVYDDDTFTMITVNNLYSTLSFTPYHVRIIDVPVFIKNSLRHLILGKMVKVENISIDIDGALLCKVSIYNWTCENDVTKLHSSHGADGILYMQEKYREYGHGIPHIT